MNTPTLTHVIRLDSMPIGKAAFTDEGYLEDRPILTSTGIFEYTNPDGSIRRELRLPDDVFDEESLKSYKGKPIIITHTAGLIDKDNVADEIIGTIISDGFKSGDDVRADIIIHDTDKMKRSGLKQLSLGYNLDLEETPGVWNGQPYDAIQRNIRVNHLALVREARAGDQARLNIDGRGETTKILKGGKKAMKTQKTVKSRRADGVISPEELDKAIAAYQKMRAADKGKEQTDADEDKAAVAEKPVTTPVAEKKEAPEAPKKAAPAKAEEKAIPEDADLETKVEALRERQAKRNATAPEASADEADNTADTQSCDTKMLFDIIDTLLAERDMAKHDSADDEEELVETENEDGDDEDEPIDKEAAGDEEDEEEDFLADDADEDLEDDEDDDEFAADEDDDEDEDDEFLTDEDEEEETDVPFFAKKNKAKEVQEDEDDEALENEYVEDCGDTDKKAALKTTVNTDSIDKIVRQRIKVGMLGRTLNLDGLEDLPLRDAKCKVIRKVKPGMRLDGKSDAYIDAAYDIVRRDIAKRSKKDTAYQRKQMFNSDGRQSNFELGDSAEKARQRMIERQQNKNKTQEDK